MPEMKPFVTQASKRGSSNGASQDEGASNKPREINFEGEMFQSAAFAEGVVKAMSGFDCGSVLLAMISPIIAPLTTSIQQMDHKWTTSWRV